jgi:hypothetical protein
MDVLSTIKHGVKIGCCVISGKPATYVEDYTRGLDDINQYLVKFPFGHLAVLNKDPKCCSILAAYNEASSSLSEGTMQLK